MEYRDWSLKQWTDMFDNIYGEVNQVYTSEQMWGRVVEKSGRLARDLRKEHVAARVDGRGRQQGIVTNLPATFAWLAAFSNRFGSLELMLWDKFPGVCPYCVVEECGCAADKHVYEPGERETKLDVLREDISQVPKTLYGWQEMFDNIYGKANRDHGLGQIGFHLFEELAEVSQAIRIRNDEYVRKELADVFAWLMGLTIKSSDMLGQELRLDDLVWDKYPNECPSCNSSPCGEKIFITESIRAV
ncbi:hypothetical protein HOD38_03500 [archaeon]|jgi:NTP pyrophosphatase (non-canonical NTP hydrolase)|nr:hypothetical protein [archaeon]MBT4397306.1 hypothetical protein [archaeon]MBT4440686.1 hypothetical protein [archaeon]